MPRRDPIVAEAFSYDLNGNLVDDGERTYGWDVENRLITINYSGTDKKTEFACDGWGRRVMIKEIDDTTTTSDQRFLWDGLSIAESRAGDGTTVNKRYFQQGFSDLGVADNFYYVKDHLGSIRAIVDDSGVERGRWSYGLFGTRSENQITTDAVTSDFGYTGHFEHPASGLVFAPYRAYSPLTGRWLSRDPIGEAGGINLYGYVYNNPINLVDPDGLQEGPIPGAPINTPQGQVGFARATEFAEKGFEVLNKTVSTPVKDAMTKGNIEAICQAERDAAARGYQAAMEKIKDAGAKAYNQARIDYAKNGGKPPGTMLDWLRSNGFAK